MKLMISFCLLALVTITAAAITKSPSTTVYTASTSTPITINPKLRKALLEALSSYDGDDSTETDDETTTSSSTESFDDVTDNPSFIKIHTFAIDGDKSDENEVIKTIIITRPRTTLTPPKVTNDIDEVQDQVQIRFNKTPDPVNEDSDKTDNIQLVRSVSTTKSSNVSEKKEDKPKKKASEKSATKPITPQSTTTTTLPPPVTNADGENIEKVAKEDVKIQQAPLLASFTVQQDINGQPKKVISHFRSAQQNDFKPSQQVQTTIPTSAPTTTTIQASTVNSNQQFITSFELKQRQLEEQIRFLQARQREQDEIIRQHQLRQDQHNRQNLIIEQRNRFEDEQRQRQRFDEEQRQRQRFEQEQQFLLRQQQSQSVQQPQTQSLQPPPSPNVNVQFIPSIPLGHTVGISVEQQLPFKGPTEFNPDKPDLQKSFAQLQQQFQFRQFQNQPNFQLQNQQNFQQQNQQTFQQQRNAGFVQQQQQLPIAQPLVQKQEVQQIASITQLPKSLELPVRSAQNFVQFTQLPTNLELPQKPFQTFNSAPLSILPSITEIVPQSQARTRVFRNDATQTGNFGFNNNQNNVQVQRQQIDPVNYSIDNQLQNLLLQSGISTRSADDFRIISKVLSLNHGIPNSLLRFN